jgi:hypothetical protein
MPVAKVNSKRHRAELRDNYRPVGAHFCGEALGRKTHSLGRMQRAASSQLGILCGHPLTGVGRFPNLAGGPAGPTTRETFHCCRRA